MTKPNNPGFIGRLLQHLRDNMAANEHEHQTAQSGWDIYVRDIFVAHHQQHIARRARQKRKPWQLNKPTDNSTTR